MLVKVKGTFDAERKTGRAETITFDSDLDGVIENDPVLDIANPSLKSFSVVGTRVIAEDRQTIFDNVTFALLAKGQIVEVSGFFDRVTAALRATRLERKDAAAATVGIQGEITQLVQSAGTGTFKVIGTIVRFDPITKLPDGGLREGLLVKVEGRVPDPINSPTILVAEEIDLKELDIPNDTETSLQGIINSFVSLRNFKVDGFTVNAANADFRPPTLASALSDGTWINVEGTFSNGILLAKALSSRQSGIEIAATISSIDPDAGQIVLNATPLQTLTVSVDDATLMSAHEDQLLGLEQVLPGTFLEVKAQQNADFLVVNHIETEVGNEIKLQGTMEGIGLAGETQGDDATGVGTVKLLGVTFNTDGDTRFEPANFFITIKEGDKIKVRDKIEANGVGDGIADAVAIED